MGKPRMIILIRHAQSEGNKNREIHQTIPDHRVKLTSEGHRQALEAGARLRALLRPDDTIHFFTSPYRRTRETTEGILESLTADTPSPSPFPRHTIKVYEEPRLREQDFGNFQPCSAEMERMWLERADYGHFFYRIPNGESAADAYDRVSGFNESMWRSFGESDFASVSVLVTHGLMTRVFLMKWYHWSVEYFEDLRNIDHCEFVIMKLNEDNGKYVLQNQLRTWSELKREKESERQRERPALDIGLAPPNPNPPETPVPIRRKWGGCPNGCNHGVHRKPSLRSSRTHGGDQHKTQENHHHHHHHAPKDPTGHNRIHIHNHGQTSLETSTSQTPAEPETITITKEQTITAPEPALGDRSGDEMPLRTLSSNTQYPSTPQEPIQHNNHPSSSPDNPPKPISSRTLNRNDEDILHPLHGLIHLIGRDGGGTLSGANSLVASEAEDEQDHVSRGQTHPYTPHRRNGNGHGHARAHEHGHNQNTHAGIKRHKPRPSHDLANDGDDEGSGQQSQKLRRVRSHRQNHGHGHGHSHLPTTPTRRATAILRKGVPSAEDNATLVENSRDENRSRSGCETEDRDRDADRDRCECQTEYEGDEFQGEAGSEVNDALERARKEDQSILGSVY
ncbi:histidine phosphatase superfamily [Aspergillus californicus]